MSASISVGYMHSRGLSQSGFSGDMSQHVNSSGMVSYLSLVIQMSFQSDSGANAFINPHRGPLLICATLLYISL